MKGLFPPFGLPVVPFCLRHPLIRLPVPSPRGEKGSWGSGVPQTQILRSLVPDWGEAVRADDAALWAGDLVDARHLTVEDTRSPATCWCPSAQSCAKLCLDGLGRFHVEPDIAAGTLMPVLEDFNPGDIEIVHAVLADPEHLAARIRAFIDFLAETI